MVGESSMEPRRKSTRLIDGEVKGIMDNYHYPVRIITIIWQGKYLTLV